MEQTKDINITDIIHQALKTMGVNDEAYQQPQLNEGIACYDLRGTGTKGIGYRVKVGNRQITYGEMIGPWCRSNSKIITNGNNRVPTPDNIQLEVKVKHMTRKTYFLMVREVYDEKREGSLFDVWFTPKGKLIVIDGPWKHKLFGIVLGREITEFYPNSTKMIKEYKRNIKETPEELVDRLLEGYLPIKSVQKG